MVRVQLHRALEQFERAGIAVGIERQNTGHRAQREIVGAEVGRRLSQRVIDLGQPQALLKRRSDPDGEVFAASAVSSRRILSARCAQSWPPVSVSISRKIEAGSATPDPLIAPAK